MCAPMPTCGDHVGLRGPAVNVEVIGFSGTFAGIWTAFNGDRGTKSEPIRSGFMSALCVVGSERSAGLLCQSLLRSCELLHTVPSAKSQSRVRVFLFCREKGLGMPQQVISS